MSRDNYTPLTDEDIRKLGTAYLQQCYDDIFNPDYSYVNELDRLESFKSLTSDEELYRDGREHWCDCVGICAHLLKKSILKQMEEKNIVINDDITPDGHDMGEIRRSFTSYKILLQQTRQTWSRSRRLMRDYGKKPKTSLFNDFEGLLKTDNRYRYIEELNILLEKKKEYEDFFKTVKFNIGTEPMYVKYKGKRRPLDFVYGELLKWV